MSGAPSALQWLYVISGYGILLLLGAIGWLAVRQLWAADLSKLISEPNGDASMSRFQFLIFTFVIALSLFLVIVGQQPPKFPDTIPAAVLSLLGISGSSYLVSKGIQFSDPAGIYGPQNGVVVAPDKPILHVGQTQQFKADVVANPAAAVKWEVIMGYGTITADGLYTADITKGPAIPAAPGGAAPAPAKPPVHATIQATVADQPDQYDLAVVTIIA